MSFFTKFPLHSLTIALSLVAASQTYATEVSSTTNNAKTQTTTLKAVQVEAEAISSSSEDTGSYTVVSSSTSTGLNLDLRDTPQSISVITQEVLEDHAMDSVSDALRIATGVTVRATDRGRNGISARGFEISNYQLDGVPTVTGNVGIDTTSTAIYDRVEIVRGATGLLNGAGDPSATINLVRKRADSKILKGKVDLTLGSWNHRGGTIDVSTPLVSDGSVRARVVAAKNEQDAFIDLEHTENTVFYGVVAADISETTQFSVGGSDERTERSGIYWGGLPIWYTDGTRVRFDKSKTTATHWNQWDTKAQSVFTTLDHHFSNDWTIRANINHHRQDEDSNLLWVWGDLDKATGEGLSAYPYLYAANPKQTQYSFIATGPFSGFDRQHELTVGLSHRKSEGGWDNGGDPLNTLPEVGNFYEWDGSYPEPVWDIPEKGSYETITQSAAYTAARLQFTDTFKVIAGVRLSNWEVDAEAGAWTATPYTITHNNLLTPYLGAIYDLSESISAYASYSDIFKPQTNRDRRGNYLDPLAGNTYETGIKGVFLDGQLNASAAIFLIQQDNFAVRDGTILDTGLPAFAAKEGTESKGYEFEVSGEVTSDWQLGMSWTEFSAKDADNNDVAVESPRRMFKLYTKYKLQGDWNNLSLGGGFNWQSQEPRRATNPATGFEQKVGQPAYSLITFVAHYEFNEHASLQLNINNALDKAYYESSWGTYTHGEPRSARLTMNYRF